MEYCVSTSGSVVKLGFLHIHLPSRKRYHLRPRSPLASASASSVPGVSILRPLKGLDVNLYENIESTFQQEYPNYEIFLCVADENDQALPIVRDLVAKYPSVNAHIIIGTFNIYDPYS